MKDYRERVFELWKMSDVEGMKIGSEFWKIKHPTN